METTLQLREGFREHLIRVLSFVLFPIVCSYLYLDWEYNVYLKEYRNTQKQEEQAVKKKIDETLTNLKILTSHLSEEIRTSPDYDDTHIDIRAHLSIGPFLSRRPHTPLPLVREIIYYKLSDPKAIITPAHVSFLPSVPASFDKPIHALKKETIQNNEMIETLPILDHRHRLKGVLETKVSYIDIQKFIGADKLKTLEFPSLFDQNGKQIILENPLAFSFKPPLSRYAYMLSYKTTLWGMAFVVFIGSLFLALCGRIVKKNATLFYGTQIGQLKELLKTLTSSRSSLEARHSFQNTLLHRLKEVGGVITHAIERLKESYTGGSLSHQKMHLLLKGTSGLAQNLSIGLTNHHIESIVVMDILEDIKQQMADKMRELNITWTITGSENLIFRGDPLFYRQILLNALGYPLYHMPERSDVLIDVTQENGFVHIEIQDQRFFLTEAIKAYLHLPEDFIEYNILRQICLQHNVGYEFFETKEGTFYTKVSFPMDSDYSQGENINNNVISLANRPLQ